MCLDGAVRKCVPCPLHVWVSTVQVCIWLHLGMCLRLWYYVNMFKVFCSSLWWNVISFPLCTQKKKQKSVKVMKALGQRREDSCMCQVVVLSVSSQLLRWKRRTFLLLPSTAFPTVVVGASVAKTTSSLMLAVRKKHTFALVVPIVTTSTLATVQRRKQQNSNLNKKLKS